MITTAHILRQSPANTAGTPGASCRSLNRGSTSELCRFSQMSARSLFWNYNASFYLWNWQARAVACRGLVMPGATAWLDAPCQILVLSSGVWWSLLLVIRCLWRHILICKPTFWRSLFTQHAYSGTPEQQ